MYIPPEFLVLISLGLLIFAWSQHTLAERTERRLGYEERARAAERALAVAKDELEAAKDELEAAHRDVEAAKDEVKTVDRDYRGAYRDGWDSALRSVKHK